jgi:hypothetical protein
MGVALKSMSSLHPDNHVLVNRCLPLGGPTPFSVVVSTSTALAGEVSALRARDLGSIYSTLAP